MFEAAGIAPEAVWARAYVDASMWPRWNDALKSAVLEGPFEVGSRARVRFRTGLRLRFELVEVEPERLFTDEGRLPGARMGHRHALEPTDTGVRLTNTLYIEVPSARVWALAVAPQAKRGLARWQRKAVNIARGEAT